MLKKPRRLRPGAHIAVLAISGPSDRQRIETAAGRLRARGFEVTVAGNVAERAHLYLAGDDDLRLVEINEAFAAGYDAFLFARGGYGAMRILDRIDYSAIARDPRPVIGFSDLTALHQALAATVGVASFHGPMLNSDFVDGLSPEIDRWFWGMLAGEAPLVHRFERSQVIAEGSAESIAFGGCLIPHGTNLRPGLIAFGPALTFVVMLALAWGKIRTGRALGNPVLRAEGKVTLVDAYLAGAVLAGLVLNALFGWWWADPLAGLVIIYYAAREARHAFKHTPEEAAA